MIETLIYLSGCATGYAVGLLLQHGWRKLASKLFTDWSLEELK